MVLLPVSCSSCRAFPSITERATPYKAPINPRHVAAMIRRTFRRTLIEPPRHARKGFLRLGSFHRHHANALLTLDRIYRCYRSRLLATHGLAWLRKISFLVPRSSTRTGEQSNCQQQL